MAILMSQSEAFVLTPTVFLSLSGHDVEFAREVWRSLPKGLAYFYQKSFHNGASLLEEMERGVGHAQIFVLLASEASLSSPWVGFEIDKARVRQISGEIDILVFPIQDNLDLAKFPMWMRDSWISPGKWGPRDIARYIQDKLVSEHLATGAEGPQIVGRGGLTDRATQVLMNGIIGNDNATPNVLFFTGTNQIGRRTFAKSFLRERLSVLPNLSSGPELRLPQFADIADLYRAIRENIDFGASSTEVGDSLQHFSNMALEEQIDEIASSLGYFADLGQAVFIGSGSGLFDDSGNPKPWLKPLIEKLAYYPETFVCLISNRQVREEFLSDTANAIQIRVPALSDADTRALITGFGSHVYGKPIVFSDSTVRAIGGHPAVAKAAARIANQRGAAVIEAQPESIFSIQESILSDNIDVNALSEVQLEIMCALSWVQSLSGSLIEGLINRRHDNGTEEFVAAMEDLVLSSLIIVHGDLYSISAEIRQLFRRRYGFGPTGLLDDFSGLLSDEWKNNEQAGSFRADLFDSFVFMYALAGKSLPPELKRLLLPSTLEEVLRQTYARGRDDRQLMEKVVEWGAIAQDMVMDDTVRESVEGIVIQAYIRLGQTSEAEARLVAFDRKGYRSAPFLKGFMKRRQGRLLDAIPLLREAIATKKNLRYSVQELATVFQKLGRADDLAELVSEHRSLVESSAVLLDFYIGTLIADNRFREAETALNRLAELPQDEGRSTIRKAQILSQRDNRHTDALELLTGLVQAGHADGSQVRRWRALIAAYANDIGTAERDIRYLETKAGQEDTARRLRVHLSLAQGDYAKAEEVFKSLDQSSASNQILQARILELKAGDASIALSVRGQARERARKIRGGARSASSFEYWG
jgi:tetratricopeptide (TPR) repeat protein